MNSQQLPFSMVNNCLRAGVRGCDYAEPSADTGQCAELCVYHQVCAVRVSLLGFLAITERSPDWGEGGGLVCDSALG